MRFLLFAGLLAITGLAAAEVADSAAGGFTAKTTLAIHAAPDEVYRRLVRDVGQWWNPDHSFSGDARNLSIDDKPAGCFCEKLAGGGGVRHMEVVHANPGKLLVMRGGLGPLQSMAAIGSWTIQLTAAEGGTRLESTMAVTGYSPGAGGMAQWARPLDTVLAQQLGRLRELIENGKPGAQ